MRCSAVCSLLLVLAAAEAPSSEVLKARLLQDLGMAREPDLSHATVTRRDLRRMTRRYMRQASRSQRTTLQPEACTDSAVVFRLPSEVKWARLRLPNASSFPAATRGRGGLLEVPCSGAPCCDAHLEVGGSGRGEKRGACGRRPLRVDFRALGWAWVVQPRHFEAFSCSGRCEGPHKFASTHALVQGLMGHPPCCAPRRLRPLDLLHFNDADPPELVVTRHDGMVVRECACT